MKLFFDARYIRLDFPDGISRYTTELANAVAKIAPETIFIICDKRQLNFLPENTPYILLHPVTSPLEPFTALRLNRYKPDVVFTPMQTMGSFGKKFKLIVTLHDLIYYKYRLPPPSAQGIIRPLWRLFHVSYWPQRVLLNLADVVATVSEVSKKEIFTARLTKQPLVVISNAARDLSPLLSAPITQKDSPPKNLIFMSTPLPYKNPGLLIRMMEYLPGRRLHLLSKISPARKAELEAQIPAKADVVFHNGVSDEKYAKLLANDAIMVNASRAEGFGLPLAEALKLGVPAVVSDRDFYHEVGGDGPLYADPEDPKDFAEKVLMFDDKATREIHIKAGKRHIDQFSWHKSAEVLLQTTKKLAK